MYLSATFDDIRIPEAHEVTSSVRLRPFHLLLVASSALSCSGPDVAFEQQRSAVIYGSDDRHDIYDETDTDIAALATSTGVALISPTELRFSGSDVLVRAAPLSAWDDYCSGTAFLDQPTAASCSGILIDDDLVLTVGHCLETVPSCRDLDYVFNYSYAREGTLGPIRRDDVFSCRTIAVQESSPPDSATQVDFAVIELDRAVVGHAPAILGQIGPLAKGDALTVIGSPSGLPVKVDSGARVVDSRSGSVDFFTLTSDTFAGNSGSGVYQADVLVGVFAHGTADFVDEGACSAERVIGDTSTSGESATYVARAIESLCAKSWPSERLCGTAPRCGDGVCSAGGTASETTATCPEDCAAPMCGDDLCEQSEWDNCRADCGDRRPAGLPDTWYCEPVWYGDGTTCDCNCGATDTDCVSKGETRACDSVGPAGFEPKAPTVAVRGGCSVATGAARGRDGWTLAAALLSALLWRHRLTRRPLAAPRMSPRAVNAILSRGRDARCGGCLCP